MEFKEVKIEIYIPKEFVIVLRDELNKINACRVGDYDNCISITNVMGYWRPLQGSNPYNGQIGEICSGEECKIEVRCKIEYVKTAVLIIKKIHPYEEPVFNIIPIINDLFQ
ncbi:cytochrome C biogenesis protein [Clostridium sp.]